MKTTKLKPCPFCGDDMPFVNEYKTNFFETRFYVVCEICQSKGKSCKSRKEAIQSWNRRVDNAEIH